MGVDKFVLLLGFAFCISPLGIAVDTITTGQWGSAESHAKPLKEQLKGT